MNFGTGVTELEYPAIANTDSLCDMFMKRLILSTFLSVILGTILFSCEKSKVRSISLLGQGTFSKNKKAYVLIDTDSFIVSTTFEKLHNAFKPWISEKSNSDEDKELFKEITKHANDNPVYVNRIATPWKYERRLIYKIADLFESGDCLVYNKMTQHVEPTVTIKEYQSPVGYDGRKFYVDSIEIFKTMDRIY